LVECTVCVFHSECNHVVHYTVIMHLYVYNKYSYLHCTWLQCWVIMYICVDHRILDTFLAFVPLCYLIRYLNNVMLFNENTVIFHSISLLSSHPFTIPVSLVLLFFFNLFVCTVLSIIIHHCNKRWVWIRFVFYVCIFIYIYLRMYIWKYWIMCNWFGPRASPLLNISYRYMDIIHIVYIYMMCKVFAVDGT